MTVVSYVLVVDMKFVLRYCICVHQKRLKEIVQKLIQNFWLQSMVCSTLEQ